MVRLAKRSQRKRIGRGAVEDEEDLAVGLKEFAEFVRCFGRPRVVSVCRYMPVIGGLCGAPRRGTDACVVVACELLKQVSRVNPGHLIVLSVGDGSPVPGVAWAQEGRGRRRLP